MHTLLFESQIRTRYFVSQEINTKDLFALLFVILLYNIKIIIQISALEGWWPQSPLWWLSARALGSDGQAYTTWPQMRQSQSRTLETRHRRQDSNPIRFVFKLFSHVFREKLTRLKSDFRSWQSTPQRTNLTLTTMAVAMGRFGPFSIPCPTEPSSKLTRGM